MVCGVGHGVYHRDQSGAFQGARGFQGVESEVGSPIESMGNTSVSESASEPYDTFFASLKG